jgi:type I restriction enzyme M protein
MLKPGGRAAIVLPQGKFNNSSLAFVREWILKKARLLAVVGLHPNTFKPHTGTKTSVLFVQKYTPAQLEKIASVQQEVAVACPDYEAEIKSLLAKFEHEAEVPDEEIPEAVSDLIIENFSEPEQEVEETKSESGEDDDGSEETGEISDEDRLAQAEEKLNGLKADLYKAKQRLIDLDSDAEAMEQQQKREIDVVTERYAGNKTELKSELKVLKDGHKEALKQFKDKQKTKLKVLKAEIKQLEVAVPNAEYDLMLLSNRGKLQLILADSDLIGALKERWIAAEVAKRLDYSIFMAVSERSGKNNSGDYEYLVDENGSLVEFPDGHPQEGQLVINQDLVNYDLTAEDLSDSVRIPDSQLCIAEAFVRFTQEHGFGFWRSE